jgi:hypothetical protein
LRFASAPEPDNGVCLRGVTLASNRVVVREKSSNLVDGPAEKAALGAARRKSSAERAQKIPIVIRRRRRNAAFTITREAAGGCQQITEIRGLAHQSRCFAAS